ncbi:MAG TPA: hypothetical protein VFF46_06065, partial [Kribbella sp.]|nr:hypothetical protein [Kribbella sp.]
MSRSALAAVLGTALLATVLSAPNPTAAAPPPPQVVPKLPHVTKPTTVTLVTGDKVTLTPDPDGTSQVQLQPVARPNGYTPHLQMVETSQQRLVVPDDALPYLSAGVLDRGLFDINYLVANGYADDATS